MAYGTKMFFSASVLKAARFGPIDLHFFSENDSILISQEYCNKVSDESLKRKRFYALMVLKARSPKSVTRPSSFPDSPFFFFRLPFFYSAFICVYIYMQPSVLGIYLHLYFYSLFVITWLSSPLKKAINHFGIGITFVNPS